MLSEKIVSIQNKFYQDLKLTNNYFKGIKLTCHNHSVFELHLYLNTSKFGRTDRMQLNNKRIKRNVY